MAPWRLGMGGNGRHTLNGVPLGTAAGPMARVHARGREPVAVLPLAVPANVVPIGRAHVIRARRRFGSFDGRAA